MGISTSDFIAMQSRLTKSRPLPPPVGEPVQRESTLHDFIISHCDSQWPRWKYIHARMDKKSCIGVGVQDFTIFASNGRVFCIECKRGNEKPDKEQVIWAKEVEMVGSKVHVVRTKEEFLEVVK